METEKASRTDWEGLVDGLQQEIVTCLEKNRFTGIMVVPNKDERGGLALLKDGSWYISSETFGQSLGKLSADEILRQYSSVTGGVHKEKIWRELVTRLEKILEMFAEDNETSQGDEVGYW